MDLKKMEEIRLKSKRLNTIGLIVLILSIVMFFLGSMVGFGGFEVIFFIGVIVGIVVVVIANSSFSKVKRDFKNKILKAEIEKRYPEIVYHPNQGLDEGFINSLHFYRRADRYHSEDMLCGKIMGVSFVSSDVHMEERHVQHTKNGTRVYYETFFRGRFYRFDFNKPFKDRILMVEGLKPGAYGGLQKVELESIEFNKKFKTYCKEKINAFYILTPQLMLSFLELEKQNPGAISILIDSNSMYMAINNNRDSFELSLNRPIDETYVDYYMKDVRTIEGIIDQLNLDNKVFKEIQKDISNL